MSKVGWEWRGDYGRCESESGVLAGFGWEVGLAGAVFVGSENQEATLEWRQLLLGVSECCASFVVKEPALATTSGLDVGVENGVVFV